MSGARRCLSAVLKAVKTGVADTTPTSAVALMPPQGQVDVSAALVPSAAVWHTYAAETSTNEVEDARQRSPGRVQI